MPKIQRKTTYFARARHVQAELVVSRVPLLDGDEFRMLASSLMNTASDVEREIRQFLVRKAPHQSDAIQALKPAEPIWGNVDSLLILSLVSHLEQTFKFEVKPKDFTPDNLASIERIVAFVGRATLASKPAAP